ncbi:uncharacterized protein JCM15063_002402 [Sporobolomyces koalae]|uniref:uncharacterized protein n=1 Tax=Sporobolomyces koalae TaxID=500713 RepID=UPI003174997C
MAQIPLRPPSPSRPSGTVSPARPNYPSTLSLGPALDLQSTPTTSPSTSTPLAHPALPSEFRNSPKRRHSRRPSRAERYEHLVENARTTLRNSHRNSRVSTGTSSIPSTSNFRFSRDLSSTTGPGQRTSFNSIDSRNDGRRGSLHLIGERLGLGPFGAPPTATTSEIGLGIQEAQDMESLASSAAPTRQGSPESPSHPIDEREWRETVRNLLLVVDGMSQQLSTHDELAAQLKIAQSNLTLAETHSEFLEETLRRREVSNNSNLGTPSTRTSTNLQRRSNTLDEESVSSLSSAGSGARSFFRLPTSSSTSSAQTTTTSSRRFPTSSPSLPPIPASSVQTTPSLRSFAASPLLGTGNDATNSRFSTSTLASFDSMPSAVTGGSDAPTTFSGVTEQEYEQLQTTIDALQHETAALRVNEESLRRNNDKMVQKCADLEKTKEDLMSELESLSVELFSEANALVAEERRARAEAETKLEQLQAELETLQSELASMRTLLNSNRTSQYYDSRSIDSPDLPALPRARTLTADQQSSSAPTSPHEPLEHSPSLVEIPSTSNRPVSTGRKWFSFGRSPSIPATTSETPLTPPMPSLGVGTDQGTPTLSVSPSLDPSTPIVSASTANRSISAPIPTSQGLGIPTVRHSHSMERSNSANSFVTARSESWFGFGSSTKDPVDDRNDTASSHMDDFERTESPLPPEKEPELLSRNTSIRSSIDPKRLSNAPSFNRDARPVSPAPSHSTTHSISTNKDLPIAVASPPLPPLPPQTPVASNRPSPVSEDFESDKLPFSSTTTNTTAATGVTTRPVKLKLGARPQAIHIAASSSSSSPDRSIRIPSPSVTSFPVCHSPASSAPTPIRSAFGTPTTPTFPLDRHSPNNSATFDRTVTSTSHSRSPPSLPLAPSPRSRESSSQKALPVVNDIQDYHKPVRKPIMISPRPGSISGTSLMSQQQQPPPLTLRIDTSSSSSILPKPTERGPKSAQPLGTTRSNETLGGSRPSLFRNKSSLSRTNPTSGTNSIATTPRFSNFKDANMKNYSIGSTSTTIQSPVDGTKAVEDLDKLMESMMDMFDP